MKTRTILLALASALSLALALVLNASTGSAASLGPVTGYHYTANGNFDSSGNYLPGSLDYNVADISSASALSWIPANVKGLAWIGTCNGADSTFKSTIDSYRGKSNLLGFYLMDDADPTGQWGPLCTAANLRAEADYIHSAVPGVLAFVLPMNLSSSSSPSFDPSYSQANTHVDAYGLDPYPCRTELNGCNYSMINGYVNAAVKIGIPATAIVPVYQTFGLGGWQDDGGGQYAVPTAPQEQQILTVWAGLTPNPLFDYAYSYGVQNSDEALSTITSLQPVMKAHNDGTYVAATPTTATPTTVAPTTAQPVPSHSTTTKPTATPTPTRLCRR